MWNYQYIWSAAQEEEGEQRAHREVRKACGQLPYVQLVWVVRLARVHLGRGGAAVSVGERRVYRYSDADTILCGHVGRETDRGLEVVQVHPRTSHRPKPRLHGLRLPLHQEVILESVLRI